MRIRPGWAEDMFRPAAQRPVSQNCVRAALQTAAMWGVFLFMLPALIVWLQSRLGFPFFDPGAWRWLALGCFVLLGLTGCYCGLLFVIHGQGTPLPLDQTTRLVIRGPYRVVRNPMAILGIGQGVAVGVWLGSWPVMVYALLGAFVWNAVARPFEERDMARRYGQEFEEYAAAVPCWIPTLRPYHAVPALAQTQCPPDFADQVETASDKDQIGL